MGDYVAEMRKLVGHILLLTIGCGVIVENEDGEILLQKRTDDGTWGTPGGGMNFGETFAEAAAREVLEETGLTVGNLSLFGIYSGKDSIVEYPNKDVCFGALVIFRTNKYSGELFAGSDESEELRFFSRDRLPRNLNRLNGIWITQWQKGQKTIFVG